MKLFVIDYVVFVVVFWLFFDKFCFNFYLVLESILYVFQGLFLEFVGEENDFHHVYVMVIFNNLNL